MIFKRAMALILAVGSFGIAAAAPLMILRMIPSVSCVKPQHMTYEKRISADGTIEAANVKEVYLETPVIAHSVNVSVGDTVKKDQVLAVIDSELTKSVLEQSIPASMMTQKLPIDRQSADLMGLYAALQGAGLAEEKLGELAQTYGAAEGIPAMNNYIYVPETITAPMDGVVTAVGVKSNVLSRTAKPVMTISDTSSFLAMVTVGESYISDIRIGDPAVIRGTGFSDKEYTGRVSKIYPVARKASSGAVQETVVDIELTIDNPDPDLKSGFTARAEILTDMRRDMLTIPYEAIEQDEENVEYVYIAENSKAIRRNITTGLELFEGVEVVSGLNENEILLANASQAGKAGARIQLQRG